MLCARSVPREINFREIKPSNGTFRTDVWGGDQQGHLLSRQDQELYQKKHAFRLSGRVLDASACTPCQRTSLASLPLSSGRRFDSRSVVSIGGFP